MHTDKTAEVLFQNTAELKQDAGNTAISILGIVGGKEQVSGSKQMLEMITKYPKTFGKRMFLEMKKSFMRKLTWAPRTVAAMFKKDTWKSLYASLRKYLSRQTDELTDNKRDRDLRRDPVRENMEDKKRGVNDKGDEKKSTSKSDKDETKVDDKEKIIVRSPKLNGEIEPAEFIRPIERGETIADIIDEAKYLTRADGVEHAVIKVKGKRYLVKGGRDGIILPEDTEIIYGHTHPNLPGTKPFNNGPSIGDRDALESVNFGKGQSKQYVFHDGQRTTIYRGMGSDFDVSITNY
jgi:hypothetical protein